MTNQKRRRFFRPRFTLAALLLLISIVSPPLAYFGQRRAWNQKRKTAIESLTAKGFGFSPEVPSEFGILPPEASPGLPPAPAPVGLQKWWRGLLLEDATSQIKMVGYSLTPRRKQSLPPVTDADCQLLALFPEIEFIEIGRADTVSDQGLSSLASLPNLRQLRLSGLTLVDGSFLRNWRKESPLQAIYFWRMEKLKGEHLTEVAIATKLEAFWIGHCPLLTDQSLLNVNLSPRVDRLMVTQCPLGDATLARWLNGRQLKNLNLSARITRNSVAAIESQVGLEQLYLRNTPFIDEDFAFLKHCTQLNNLTLESVPVKGELLKWLNPDKLSNLSLNSTLLDDSHIASLDRFPSLFSLGLEFTPISGEGFEGVGPFPSSCRISLIGAQFTDQGKAALAKIRFQPGVNSEFSTVALPSNWTLDDFKKFPEGVAPWKFDVDIALALSARKSGGANLSYYQAASPLRWAAAPLDNCPAELITPVSTLRDIVLRRSDEEEKRLVEEYFRTKPAPTPSSTKN